MLERKGGNWLPFNAQLDLSTTKALISKSVINTKYIFKRCYAILFLNSNLDGISKHYICLAVL
jgi:hypothetical protein